MSALINSGHLILAKGGSYQVHLVLSREQTSYEPIVKQEVQKFIKKEIKPEVKQEARKKLKLAQNDTDNQEVSLYEVF